MYLFNPRGDYWAEIGLIDQYKNIPGPNIGQGTFSYWSHHVSELFVSVFGSAYRMIVSVESRTNLLHILLFINELG